MKTKAQTSERNKIYYQKTRKDDTMTRAEQLDALAKSKIKANYNITLEAYNKAIEQGIKTTVLNIVKIGGLSKNTTNKYLRMIKNGTTPTAVKYIDDSKMEN